MDIVMLITRSSQLRQGSMGCLLVRPAETTTFDAAEPDPGRNEPFGRIIAAAVNTSLFQPDESDVHAEINAIGQVAQRNSSPKKPTSTLGATAYITMPPCKRCFGALHAAGISRSRRNSRRGWANCSPRTVADVSLWITKGPRKYQSKGNEGRKRSRLGNWRR